MRHRVINPNGDGSISYAPEEIHDQIVEAGGLHAIGRTFVETSEDIQEAAEKFQAVLDVYKRVERGAIVDDIPTRAVPGLIARGKIEVYLEPQPAPPLVDGPGAAPALDGGSD